MKAAKRTYPTPQAHKVALEDHLRNRAARQSPPLPIDRVRQRFIMERFLARVVAELGDAVTLKGGLALELRISTARSTKDIDLRMTGRADDVLALLQRAALRDPGDLLTFTVEPNARHPEIEEALYEGRRFDVKAMLAAKVYGNRLTVDVSMGDPMHGATELAEGIDFLDYLEIAPVSIRLYPLETHLAEKLHAYTRPPRNPLRVNSRVKDLPDIAIIAGLRAFDAAALRAAFAQTFTARDTHPVPKNVPGPPASWADAYLEMVAEHRLRWATVSDLHSAVTTFLGPALAGVCGTWDPSAWRWV